MSVRFRARTFGGGQWVIADHQIVGTVTQDPNGWWAAVPSARFTVTAPDRLYPTRGAAADALVELAGLVGTGA